MKDPNEELRESWFGTPVRVSAPPRISLAPERPHGTTFGMGAFAGAIGGAAAVLVAGMVSARDPNAFLAMATTIGRMWGSTSFVGIGVGAVVGAMFGGLLALVMRHGTRFMGRAIFGAAATCAVWFCAHLVLLSRHHATLPLVPMLAGAGVCGVIIAFVPPSR